MKPGDIIELESYQQLRVKDFLERFEEEKKKDIHEASKILEEMWQFIRRHEPELENWEMHLVDDTTKVQITIPRVR